MKQSVQTPTLETARAYAQDGAFQTIPLSRELLADLRTPLQVLQALQNVSSHVFMLESVEDRTRWGRYTFLGYDPGLELSCRAGRLRVGGATRITLDNADPRAAVRQVLAENKSPRLPGLPSFTGGLVGYFGYDYIRYSEPTLALTARDEEQFNDVDLMLFDKIIAFDHFRQKIILMANIHTKDLETEYRRGVRALDEMEALVRRGQPRPIPPARLESAFRPLFTKEQYCAMVARAKQYIYEGDIFQVVLSNRLEADFSGSLLDPYRVLRTLNPSPYMFYFSSEDIELAGASPETLVKLENGVVHTFPLAGTRPRGKTDAEDRALEAELLADEKEGAEHAMLVDLGRNDIGRISEFGSVAVDRYRSVERFSHVMHIGSSVRGTLRAGLTAVDAVDAILPAGTLSGAPKLRACQIINELEDNKRGIYGGAVGYLDFAGNLDTCIGIRLAFAKNGRVFVRSGAGIVADSVPENEYQECLNKAGAVLKALELGQGGLDE